MDQTANTQSDDIAKEQYQGPGRLVTAAGEGAATHYATGFGGLILGGIASAFGYKQVNAIDKSFLSFSERNRQSGSVLKRAIAHMASWPHFVAHKSVEHLPFKEKLFARIPTQRLEAVVFGSGLAGFIGFFIAPIYFGFTGVRHANQGREQFERLKRTIIGQNDEIAIKNEELAILREQYAATKVALDTTKALQQPGLRVAPDDAPIVPATPLPVALTDTAHPDSPTHVTSPVIEGTPIEPAQTTGRVIPRDEADSPTTISKPTIKEPVLGPEHAAKHEHHAKGEKDWAQHAMAAAASDMLPLNR